MIITRCTIASIAPPWRFQREKVMNQSQQTDIAAAILRTGLGVMFIAHALLKIFVFTVPGTVQFAIKGSARKRTVNIVPAA